MKKSSILIVFLFLSCAYRNESEQTSREGKTDFNSGYELYREVCTAPEPLCMARKATAYEACEACKNSCIISNIGDSTSAYYACIDKLDAALGIDNYTAFDLVDCVSETAVFSCNDGCQAGSDCQEGETSCNYIEVECSDPLFPSEEEEDMYENLVDFEVFGDEGEEEFINLLIEIDGFGVTNHDNININDNIITVENIVPGRHVFSFGASGYEAYSLPVNVAETPGATQKVQIILSRE